MKRILKTFIIKLRKRLTTADKAGLYITVIFHLTVIIVLLASRLATMAVQDNAFLMDFSGQEEQERMEQEQKFKEEISRRLDELIGIPSSPASGEEIRNIAVDASSGLKDDRGTDTEDLYRDAERLQRELSDNRAAIEEDARSETVDLGRSDNSDRDDKGKEYKGPSVVSYSLDGRKASHLSIPAYRCMEAGDVTVIITVNPQGYVLDAKILDDVSSSDRCLRDFAIRAARLSRFSVLPQSKVRELPRQRGEIVYRFIAQ